MQRLLGFGGLVVLVVALGGAAPAAAGHIPSDDHPSICVPNPFFPTDPYRHYFCLGGEGEGS